MARFGLSDDWTGGLHRGLRGRDVENRLALVLGPVQSVIRVVDPRTPPMRVEWAAVGRDASGSPLSMSATDFRGGRCVINPLPVLEDKLDPADQVDVSIGQALHEASHSKSTRDVWFSTLLKKTYIGHEDQRHVEEPAFEPLRVAAWLLNVAEDVRVEGLTAAEWPGFAPYFDRLLDWLWEESTKREPAETPRPALDARMRTAFMGARFFARASATAQDAEEMAWWRDWAADHVAGRCTPSETVQRGLDRLGEDEQAQREMSQMAVEDREQRKAGEDARKLLERLLREGVDGMQSCVMGSAEESPLSQEEAEAVDRLVREGLATVTPIIRHRGAAQPEMRHRKPLEGVESKRAFVGRPDPMVEAMRSALVFRQESPRRDLKLQRRGEMDDEELWRWAAGDDRLFTERIVEDRPDTALGMLVDISGSMAGRKLRTAQRLAQILLAAAMDKEGVTPRVWAHTGDSQYGSGADVFTVWEPGDPATRLGLIGSLDNGNNYDGAAVGYCADRLRQMEQPQKVLLVLSDGLPAGSGYGGAEAQAHVRQTVRWAASQGVTVIQIAIDEGMRAADQEAMYGPGGWIQYTSDRQLPRDLTRLLERYAR